MPVQSGGPGRPRRRGAATTSRRRRSGRCRCAGPRRLPAGPPRCLRPTSCRPRSRSTAPVDRATVERPAHRHPDRLVDPDADRVGHPDARRLPDPGRGRRRRVGTAVRLPGEGEEEHGQRDRGELEPELERLDERDRAHPAGDDVEHDDDRDDERADPPRGPGDGPQREAGALELRQQVEPADADDEHRRQPAHGPRPQPDLGEVRQRVRAGAAQRRRDECEEDQVARGVPDRVPEDVDAEGEDEARDAEERRRRQVLPTDRGRVPARADRPARDVEVGRRPATAAGPPRRHRGSRAPRGRPRRPGPGGGVRGDHPSDSSSVHPSGGAGRP